MTEYVTSREKQALFSVLLDLLSELNRVCAKYNITYYACGGTLLGAIRHKGFIPWDDDVDVILPRKDYDKLKKIADTGAFKEPYFFQSPSTDEGYPKGFCRLRNSYTTETPFDDVAMNCNRGVFIDIFPLDIIPDDNKKYKKQFNKLKMIRLFMNAYARYYSGFGTEGTTKIKSIVYYALVPLFASKILTTNKLFNLYEKVASQYLDTDNHRAGPIALLNPSDRVIYDRCLWEGQTIWWNFENIKISVPEYYDDILKISYGDYMTPVQETSLHGTILFSSEIPYQEFIKQHFDELKAGWYMQTETGRRHVSLTDNENM